MSDFASAFESAWGEGKHPVLNCKQVRNTYISMIIYTDRLIGRHTYKSTYKSFLSLTLVHS